MSDRPSDRDDHEGQQDRAMMLALRGAHWQLETYAHELAAGRMTPEAWKELETQLEYLLELVRARSGDTGAPAIERAPRPVEAPDSD